MPNRSASSRALQALQESCYTDLVKREQSIGRDTSSELIDSQTPTIVGESRTKVRGLWLDLDFFRGKPNQFVDANIIALQLV
jgi:hypothetical protein